LGSPDFPLVSVCLCFFGRPCVFRNVFHGATVGQWWGDKARQIWRGGSHGGWLRCSFWTSLASLGGCAARRSFWAVCCSWGAGSPLPGLVPGVFGSAGSLWGSGAPGCECVGLCALCPLFLKGDLGGLRVFEVVGPTVGGSGVLFGPLWRLLGLCGSQVFLGIVSRWGFSGGAWFVWVVQHCCKS
jgi:hypothetical protein